MQHQETETGNNGYRISGLSAENISDRKAGQGVRGSFAHDKSGRACQPDHACGEFSRERISGNGRPGNYRKFSG